MREYYVLENWASEMVQVHEASCQACADATAKTDGKWHGPFASPIKAERVAKTLSEGAALLCDHCLQPVK